MECTALKELVDVLYKAEYGREIVGDEPIDLEIDVPWWMEDDTMFEGIEGVRVSGKLRASRDDSGSSIIPLEPSDENGWTITLDQLRDCLKGARDKTLQKRALFEVPVWVYGSDVVALPAALQDFEYNPNTDRLVIRMEIWDSTIEEDDEEYEED